MIEQERKFVVQPVPLEKLLGFQWKHLAQGYLVTGESELRVCRGRKSNRHIVGIKTGSGMFREELEVEVLDQMLGAMLLTLCGDRVVEKTRYTLREAPWEVVLDRYTGKLEGLWIMEAEGEAVNEFQPERIRFIRTLAEVTSDPLFKNQSLAQLPGPPEVGGRPVNFRHT